MDTETKDLIYGIVGIIVTLLVLLALCLTFVFDMKVEEALTIVGVIIGVLLALVGLVFALGVASVIGLAVWGVIIVVWKAITVYPGATSFIGTFIVVWYFGASFYTAAGVGVGVGMLVALPCYMVKKARKLSADKRAQEFALEKQKNRVVVFLEHCCSHAKWYESQLQEAEDHLNKRQAFPFWEALEKCGSWPVFSPAPGLNDWGAYASYEGLSNKLKIRIHKLYNRAIADNQFAIIHQQRETNALLREVVAQFQRLVVNTREIANNTAAAAASMASIDEHVGNMGKVLSAIESHTAATASNTAAIKRTSAKAASGISALNTKADQQVDATRAQGRGDNLNI